MRFYPLTKADIGGALASVPTDAQPNIVRVVNDIPGTNWYRPDSRTLASKGLPKDGPRAWIRDPGTGGYVRLAKA